jgi:hypothetical protein
VESKGFFVNDLMQDLRDGEVCAAGGGVVGAI